MDRVDHGTSNRGERCHTAKLTAADVIDIRRCAAEGQTQRAIARVYGVNHRTIGQIVQRKKWSWLN